MLMECRFGAIPEDALAESVMQRLLRVNRALCESGPAGFAMDAATGDVLFVQVHEFEAAAVTGAMTRLVAQSRRWLRSFYLDDDEQDEPARIVSVRTFPGTAPGLPRGPVVDEAKVAKVVGAPSRRFR